MRQEAEAHAAAEKQLCNYVMINLIRFVNYVMINCNYVMINFDSGIRQEAEAHAASGNYNYVIV